MKLCAAHWRKVFNEAFLEANGVRCAECGLGADAHHVRFTAGEDDPRNGTWVCVP